jgi:hypothetical protein
MVLELDRRFPGLGRRIEDSMAVAIEGDIFQDACLARLRPESEIYLIPKIGWRLRYRSRGCGGTATLADPGKSTPDRLPCFPPDRCIRPLVRPNRPPVYPRRLPARKYLIKNGVFSISRADFGMESIFHAVFAGLTGVANIGGG